MCTLYKSILSIGLILKNTNLNYSLLIAVFLFSISAF